MAFGRRPSSSSTGFLDRASQRQNTQTLSYVFAPGGSSTTGSSWNFAQQQSTPFLNNMQNTGPSTPSYFDVEPRNPSNLQQPSFSFSDTGEQGQNATFSKFTWATTTNPQQQQQQQQQQFFTAAAPDSSRKRKQPDKELPNAQRARVSNDPQTLSGPELCDKELTLYEDTLELLTKFLTLFTSQSKNPNCHAFKANETVVDRRSLLMSFLYGLKNQLANLRAGGCIDNSNGTREDKIVRKDCRNELLANVKKLEKIRGMTQNDFFCAEDDQKTFQTFFELIKILSNNIVNTLTTLTSDNVLDHSVKYFKQLKHWQKRRASLLEWERKFQTATQQNEMVQNPAATVVLDTLGQIRVVDETLPLSPEVLPLLRERVNAAEKENRPLGSDQIATLLSSDNSIWQKMYYTLGWTFSGILSFFDRLRTGEWKKNKLQTIGLVVGTTVSLTLCGGMIFLLHGLVTDFLTNIFGAGSWVINDMGGYLLRKATNAITYPLVDLPKSIMTSANIYVAGQGGVLDFTDRIRDCAELIRVVVRFFVCNGLKIMLLATPTAVFLTKYSSYVSWILSCLWNPKFSKTRNNNNNNNNNNNIDNDPSTAEKIVTKIWQGTLMMFVGNLLLKAVLAQCPGDDPVITTPGPVLAKPEEGEGVFASFNGLLSGFYSAGNAATPSPLGSTVTNSPIPPSVPIPASSPIPTPAPIPTPTPAPVPTFVREVVTAQGMVDVTFLNSGNVIRVHSGVLQNLKPVPIATHAGILPNMVPSSMEAFKVYEASNLENTLSTVGQKIGKVNLLSTNPEERTKSMQLINQVMVWTLKRAKLIHESGGFTDDMPISHGTLAQATEFLRSFWEQTDIVSLGHVAMLTVFGASSIGNRVS